MRVFVSSTFVDLVEHRAAAARALERLGQQVGRMEVFGARPDEPARACLDEIDQCSVFVGLYAHRYGYAPEGSEISITEIEFNHAHERGKAMFCFLASERHPWPPEFIEDGPGRERLRKFRSRIANLYVVDRFTTEDNLSALVASSVGRFVARFSNEVVEGSDPSIVPDVLVTGLGALSRGMAMLCIDLMRLLSIPASPAVRAANQQRYREFLSMADQRITDLRSTYILFAKYLTPDIAAQLQPLDTQLSWLLLRLRQGPEFDDRSLQSCVAALYDIGCLVDSLCDLALGGEYRAVRERVAAACSRHQGSIDTIAELCEARLMIQSDLVQRHAVSSIVEDRHQKLAVEYFCLDRHLLTDWRASSGAGVSVPPRNC